MSMDKMIPLMLGGIYQIMWRYAGVRDVARLCLLSAIACGVTLALNQFPVSYTHLTAAARLR